MQKMLKLNSEILRIAESCSKRLNSGNIRLIERLFKAKVVGLYLNEFGCKGRQYLPSGIEDIFRQYVERQEMKGRFIK